MTDTPIGKFLQQLELMLRELHLHTAHRHDISVEVDDGMFVYWYGATPRVDYINIPPGEAKLGVYRPLPNSFTFGNAAGSITVRRKP